MKKRSFARFFLIGIALLSERGVLADEVPSRADVEKTAEAIMLGDSAAFERAVKKYGRELEKFPHPGGRVSLVHLAAMLANSKELEFLFERGWRANEVDEKDETPLEAALSGWFIGAPEKLRSGKFASPEEALFVDPKKAEEQKLEVVQLLLKNGAVIRPKALLLAIQNRLPRIVQVLVEKGANVNAADEYQTSALVLAIQKKEASTAKFLLEHGAFPDAKSRRGESPLGAAVESNQAEIVKLLLARNVSPHEMSATSPRTLIDVASDNGFIEIVKLLSERGARVTPKTAPTTIPARTLSFEEERITRENNFVHAILDEGKDVDDRDQSGNTALIILAKNGSVNEVRRVMDRGAVLNVENYFRETPLMMACARRESAGWPIENSVAIVTLLLEHGADVDYKNRGGERILHHAARFAYPEVLAVILSRANDINDQNDAGDTPLIAAIKHDRGPGTLPELIAVIQMLLARGADPNIHNFTKESALTACASRGYEPCVKLLLESGARITPAEVVSLKGLPGVEKHPDMMLMLAEAAATHP